MSIGILFVLAIAVAVATAVYFVRPRNRGRRARFVKWSGFGLMALSSVFFGIFVVGETFADPGGWQAAGLVATWAAPLAALATVAWFRPAWSVPIFAVLAAVLIGLSIWFAASPQAWRSFENRNGPIRDIVTFVLAAAISVLGLKRTAAPGRCCSPSASSRPPFPAWEAGGA